MAASKEKLTEKELIRLWNRYMWSYNSQGNYTRFHGIGYVFSLIPLFQKYYDKDGQIEGMNRHSSSMSTEMQLGSLLFGIVVGMEEDKALGHPIDNAIISSTKTSLMGPLAGIGDSMIPGIIIPLLLAIAMGIAENGSVLGPLFYIISYLSMIVFGSKYLFFKGHELGINATKLIMGDQSRQICDAITIVGIIVMGAIAAGKISFTINLSLAGISIQKMLDMVYPKLLPLALTICIWLVLRRTKIQTMSLIGILAVFSFLAALLGII